MAQNDYETMDVVLVGAGIMSATLAVLLKELDPAIKLEVLEMMESGAIESSNPWNNAGTGHAGLCELNYTPESADGSIDIKKSVTINTQFEESKQFWAYLVEKGRFGSPKSFINPVPHLSFVRGQKGIDYLKKRFQALTVHHAFADMEYTEDKATLAEWMPLMMPGRDPNEPIAATRVMAGTDVNFGNLTTHLLAHLGQQADAKVSCNQKVVGLKRSGQGWRVSVKDLQSGNNREIQAKFVFLGAGGAALPLLQMSGIPEGKGFGGFPVSGQWLRCDNPEIVKQHQAKVYSQASVGAPPMSVPHLDTRVVDGKASLLFGPYATANPKFLKNGSLFDLPATLRPANLVPYLAVALGNFPLIKYLVGELAKSKDKKFESLLEFMPEAKPEDWRLLNAGQRAQVIKKDRKKGGILQFGTEVVTSADGSISGLLGASPGASTAVYVMLQVLERSFANEFDGWQAKLKQIIPSHGSKLSADPAAAACDREARGAARAPSGGGRGGA